MTLTKTQLEALQAKAGLMMYRIKWTQKEIDKLTERRARYEKELNNLLAMIKAAQTATVVEAQASNP